MSKILVTGFKGNLNTMQVILSKINLNVDKFLFTNSFDVITKELENKLQNNYYDYIISMGHKPLIKSLFIELAALKGGITYNSNFDYPKLLSFLESKKYKFKVSNNSGNYLCAHVYFEGLKYIKENNLNTKMIFIHVPYLKNVENIDKLSKDLSQFIEAL